MSKSVPDMFDYAGYTYLDIRIYTPGGKAPGMNTARFEEDPDEGRMLSLLADEDTPAKVIEYCNDQTPALQIAAVSASIESIHFIREPNAATMALHKILWGSE